MHPPPSAGGSLPATHGKCTSPGRSSRSCPKHWRRRWTRPSKGRHRLTKATSSRLLLLLAKGSKPAWRTWGRLLLLKPTKAPKPGCSRLRWPAAKAAKGRHRRLLLLLLAKGRCNWLLLLLLAKGCRSRLHSTKPAAKGRWLGRGSLRGAETTKCWLACCRTSPK